MKTLAALLLLVVALSISLVGSAPAYSPPPPPRSVSGAAQIKPGDCGGTIVASGAALYAVTFPAPNASSGFVDGCTVEVLNKDNRGKTITVNGLTNGGFGYTGCGVGNICPTQTVVYTVHGGWVLTKDPGAWRPTTSPIFYVGTNGANTNDGLDVASPFTLSFGCLARGLLDLTGSSAGLNVTLQLASTNFLGASGQTLCTLVGNYGAASSALTFLAGNTSSPSSVNVQAPVNGVAIFTKDLAEVGLSDFMISATGGTGIFGAQYSVIDLNHGMVLGCMGAPNGLGWQIGQYASLNNNSTTTVTSPCTQTSLGYLYVGGTIAGNGTFSFTSGGTNTYTGGVFVNQGGFWDFRGINFSIAATVAGKKFTHYGGGSSGAAVPGALYTNAQKPSSYFPGSIDVAFPATFPTDFDVSSPLAAMPGCATGAIGAMYVISDSTVNTPGSFISGGGSYKVLGACSSSGGLVVVVALP